MVNRNGLPEAQRRVTARVPSGQQRNKLRGRDACRTEVTSRSHKEQGESLVRKFEQELAELTEACTACPFNDALHDVLCDVALAKTYV